jgi:hypothetical protein
MSAFGNFSYTCHLLYFIENIHKCIFLLQLKFISLSFTYKQKAILNL